MTTLIIVDDSPEDREWMSDLASQIGVTDLCTFAEPQPALEYLRHNHVRLVLLDDRLGFERGAVYLPSFAAYSKNTKTVVVTGSPVDTLGGYLKALDVKHVYKDQLTPDVLRNLLASCPTG